MLELIEKVSHQLKKPLPGQEAQYRMATAFRYNRMPAPAGAVKASVLALFYPKGDQWHIVLIERASRYVQDRHRGQISFPGGRFEPSDPSLEYTALREAEEEIGIDAGKVEVLGQLTELYIPVSNFLVYPYVAYTDEYPTFTPQPSEVANILEVPFDHFLSDQNVRTMDMTVRENIRLKDVPYFDISGKVLWGATAMMMSELLALVE
ncbi:NUDIX hydrolase [Flavilitoribacter nigricans]|uniref:Coenzyme A pyrophosphatase n=1 Tax=Flavilitoribacter nigricans (strain ATCC 23147 / DSM 23189 / NBRC 102662 / NCIMB 1420 / SS-2) TaxID=1122177 RepID=A0A2D0N609_FLAN2|nr:CoA pyrophosphatase [Flavilitoribacter nigricans]PHN03962.1 coenzyme A pyrophosphatase [Flavilitoribacter nigricans DSM 23189 = NBRC 102662]